MFYMVKKKDISSAAAVLGSKGGKKAASNLTAKERSERGKMAIKARWERKKVGEEKNKWCRPMWRIRHVPDDITASCWDVQSKIQKRFGDRILRLRSERGLTQEALGGLSGLSREHISYLENGKREACIENIGRLAKAFKITVSELMKDV
jgi:DNA-binding XRE family transcriptional regulator